jgi:hypothetical protein
MKWMVVIGAAFVLGLCVLIFGVERANFDSDFHCTLSHKIASNLSGNADSLAPCVQ